MEGSVEMNKNVCLICGYNELEERPYYSDFAGSNEICPCCGFEFGVDDFDCDEFDHEGLTDQEIVEKSHIIWRKHWIENGLELFNPKIFSPEFRNGKFLKRDYLEIQLKKNLGLDFNDI